MGRRTRSGDSRAIKSKAVEAAVSAANLEELQAARLPPQRPSCNSLFVNSCRLGFGKKFLKIWIVTGWAPGRGVFSPAKKNFFLGGGWGALAKFFFPPLQSGLCALGFGPVG